MVDLEFDIKNCVSAIQKGGVILYPTDTIWGLGCNALDEAAVDKIFAVKHRPSHKSVIVLLADARDILQFVAAPHPNIIEIVNGFEVPTTVIFDHALDFPPNVVSADGSIGIRVTTDPFCKALIKRLKYPIVSTSANISGQPSPAIFAEVSREIKENVDYVVKYRQTDNELKSPSRIVKINDDGELIILRG